MSDLLSGASRVHFIVGDPIAQVKSPSGVTQAYHERGHNAFVMPAHVAPADLAAWLERVFLRYPDGAQHLPECWLWHPDVVEELTWLRLAWTLVYHPELGTPLMVGDWHDRYRPGVVRRIRERAGTCSLERHREEAVGAEPVVPLVEAVDLIARWWGDRRLMPAPAPSDEHLALADRLRRSGGGRR